MGTFVPLTTEDWARVRYEYESTDRKVAEICAEHGISAGTLRDRVRRWGWKRRGSGPVPREGPPLTVVPMIALAAPQVQPLQIAEAPHLDPLPASGERESLTSEAAAHIFEDGRERPFTLPDARPIRERLQGAIAQVMPALETTLASLAAGPMQPRQMEQAARALGSLTRTLRELNGLVAEYGAQRGGDDPPAWKQFALSEDDAALL